MPHKRSVSKEFSSGFSSLPLYALYMELTRRHLRVLRRWRGETSRKDLAKRISGDSKPPLHEMTLYKRERGDLPVSAEDLRKWLQALDRGPEELDEEVKKLDFLKLPICPYPDFTFFILAAGVRPHRNLDDWEPLEAVVTPYEYDAIPTALASGELHAALWGEDAFKRREELEPELADKILVAGPALLFRGYAILCTNHPGLLSFGNAFRSIRHHDLEHRVGLTVAEVFWKAAQEGADFLVPAKTTMRVLAEQLLGIAKKFSPPERHSALDQLVLKNPVNNKADNEVNDEFLKRVALPDGKPALFFGGLSHRLLSEEHGAACLISNDNLGKIANHFPDVGGELFGKNILLFSSVAYEKMQDDLASMVVNWNLLTSAVGHDPEVTKAVSAQVEARLCQAYPNQSFEGAKGHFVRAAREVMLQFFTINLKRRFSKSKSDE